MLIENQEYLDKDVWILIRKLILACFVSLYVLLPAHLIITSFNSNSLDAKKAIHYSAIKKWSYIFFIATSLILTRGMLNFLLDLDILDNFGLLVSEILKFIFWTVILFKVLTTPEILFGYKKLRNTVNQDPEIHAEQGLTKKGDNYYINNKTIDAYFEGKSLECVLTLLNNTHQFIRLNTLDDIFKSDSYTSPPTLKKRRDKCLKDIEYKLSFKLNISENTVFIFSSEQDDKRIKRIKLNPDIVDLL